MITHVQNEWKKHAKGQGKFKPMIMICYFIISFFVPKLFFRYC